MKLCKFAVLLSLISMVGHADVLPHMSVDYKVRLVKKLSQMNPRPDKVFVCNSFVVYKETESDAETWVAYGLRAHLKDCRYYNTSTCDQETLPETRYTRPSPKQQPGITEFTEDFEAYGGGGWSISGGSYYERERIRISGAAAAPHIELSHKSTSFPESFHRYESRVSQDCKAMTATEFLADGRMKRLLDTANADAANPDNKVIDAPCSASVPVTPPGYYYQSMSRKNDTCSYSYLKIGVDWNQIGASSGATTE